MKIKNKDDIIGFLKDIINCEDINNIIGVNVYMMLLEKDMNILYSCQNLNDILGKDVTNKKLIDIDIKKETYEIIRKAILECLFTYNQTFSEILLDNKIYKISITPIFNDNDEIIYLLLSSYDTTINKKIEQEIQYLKDKIIESDSIKTLFLSNISHELKTPMNAILGFSDILLESASDHNMAQVLRNVNFLKSINSNAKYLDELLNNILDYSKIESNVFDILYENFSVNDIFDELESIFKSINNSKNFNLVKLDFIKNDNDIKIISDYLRLKQILFNLISNSIKFTEKGYIKISYELSEDSITFIVEDTGIGISEDKLKLIFDRFYQCDSSSTKRYKGAGLGLSICKSITKLLDGEIYAESKLGKGTKFYVSLPLEEKVENNDIEIDIVDKIEFSGMTIMVIDELPINYSLLGLYLNNLNIDVIPVYNGSEAIKTYSDKYNYIDLIILDFNLPDIKSSLLIDKLKSINNNCKIISKSGKNRKIKNADYHIKKPVNKDKLIVILNELWQK